MITRLTVASIILTVLGLPQPPRITGFDDKVVDFYVIDESGTQLPFNVRGLFSREEPRTNLASKCKGSTCSFLKPSDYSYRLADPTTGREIGGTVPIWRPETFVTKVYSPGDRSGVEVAGVIRGLRDLSKRPVWLRLQNFYADESVQVKIGNDGRFRASNVLQGMWLLMVFQEGKLVLARQLDLRKARGWVPELEVTVAGVPETVTTVVVR
jgi:hypothetical protein